MNNREQLLDQLLKDLDSVTTGAIRFLAARTSRRSFFGKLGILLAGMGTLPMLPVIREASAQSSDDIPDMGNPKPLRNKFTTIIDFNKVGRRDDLIHTRITEERVGIV